MKDIGEMVLKKEKGFELRQMGASFKSNGKAVESKEKVFC